MKKFRAERKVGEKDSFRLSSSRYFRPFNLKTDWFFYATPRRKMIDATRAADASN